MGEMVEIRVLDESIKDTDWERVPVTAYMPTFLSSLNENIANVKKRISQLYLQDGKRVRWNFKDDLKTGYWVT